MKEKKEIKVDALSNITMSDLVTFVVTNDVANYDYARKEVKKLKAKYRFVSFVLILYILYKEKVLHNIVKDIDQEINNR